MTRKCKNLEQEGLEDDLGLVDKATIAEREWDEWKESSAHHHRGAGNKAGKRI